MSATKWRSGFALLAAACLAGCAGVGGVAVPTKGQYIGSAAAQSAPVSYEPEPVRLQHVLLQGKGILHEPNVDAYVARITRKLLAGWPVPNTSIPVYIIPDPDFTAEGTAASTVFLTTGVLQYLADHPELATEDSLAFILAHELSHVLLGHARDRAHMQEMVHRASGALALVGNVLRQSKKAEIVQDATKGTMALLMGIEVADGGLFPGMSREQEYQADVLAADLMARAGYSLDAVPKILQVLEAQEALDEQRQARTKAQLIQALPNGVNIQLGPVLMDWWKSVGVSHPSAKDREAQVTTYIRREHDDDSAHFQRAPMQAFLRNAAVRQMLADTHFVLTFHDVFRTDQRLTAGRFLSAIRSQAVRESSLALTIATVLARRSFQGDSYDRLVDQALSGPYATAELFQFRADQLETAGSYDKAATIYRTAYERFDDPSFFPGQIRMLRKLQRGTEATTVAAKCFLTGRPDLQEACSQASKA